MIEVKKLLCGYKGGFHLKIEHFAVSSGEFISIIGPNGSGKSTFIKALSRIIRPISGEVLLNGKDIWGISAKEFARFVAVVSQDVPVSNLKVQEFVLLGRIPYYRPFQFFESSRDIETATWAMEITGVLHLRNCYLRNISGGERQLVMLARALAQEPSFLLLDEPIAHLDIANQLEVLNLLTELKRRLQIGVVAVLHDLNMASEYSDKIVLLNEGRIRVQGSPHHVIKEEILESVYKIKIVVEPNPISRRPYVVIGRVVQSFE